MVRVDNDKTRTLASSLSPQPGEYEQHVKLGQASAASITARTAKIVVAAVDVGILNLTNYSRRRRRL